MYVQRDEGGLIIGTFTNPQPGVAEEWVKNAEIQRPPMTDEEMKQSEIEQDKQYLSDTDWIVAKIGEASITGHDVGPMLDHYSDELAQRENARIRIRLNEGRE